MRVDCAFCQQFFTALRGGHQWLCNNASWSADDFDKRCISVHRPGKSDCVGAVKSDQISARIKASRSDLRVVSAATERRLVDHAQTSRAADNSMDDRGDLFGECRPD
jgi:hypothetical protein